MSGKSYKFAVFAVLSVGLLFTAAFGPSETNDYYRIADTKNGFTLTMKDDKHQVMDGYMPPGDGQWTAYWIDSSEILFVNVETRQTRRIVHSSVDAAESKQKCDCEVRPIGFTTDNDFIYVSARMEAGKAAYALISYSLTSGVATKLFALGTADYQFRGPMWLNGNRDTLMIASSEDGRIVHYDLRKRMSFTLSTRFPGEWPYDGVGYSETGNYFSAWNIYDLNGKRVNPIHNRNPRVKTPDQYYKRMSFGPNDKYIARSYTLEDDGTKALDAYEAAYDWTFATEAIDIERLNGELVRRIETKPGSKRFVELVRWLSPRIIELHYYKLKQVPSADPLIVDSTYVHFDIATGQAKPIPAPPEAYVYRAGHFTIRNEWSIEIVNGASETDERTGVQTADPDAIAFTSMSQVYQM